MNTKHASPTKPKPSSKQSEPSLNGRILSATALVHKGWSSVKSSGLTWILAPNSETQTLKTSKFTSQGGFDDDKTTVKGTLARIVGTTASGPRPSR